MLGTLVVAIVIGFLAGILARAIMPGRDPMSLPMTTLLGIVGAVIGFFLFRAIGIGDQDTFDFGSLPGAVIGALIVLFIYRRVARHEGSAPGQGRMAPR